MIDWKKILVVSLMTFLSVFCDQLVVNNRKSAFDLGESELTITVSPGSSDCFYQTAKIGETLEIEYQVIDASFGEVELNQDLDINFILYSPSGRELIADFRQPDAIHRHDVKENGDYKVCFDNRYSHFSKKTVYFEIYVDDNNNDDYGKWDDVDDFSFAPELQYNDTMEFIKKSVNKVHEFLNQVKHHQDQLKAIESRDRNLQEHNFTRVNHFSIAIIIVMIVVGTIQVFMVRSLFEEKSRLHRIFQLLS